MMYKIAKSLFPGAAAACILGCACDVRNSVSLRGGKPPAETNDAPLLISVDCPIHGASTAGIDVDPKLGPSVRVVKRENVVVEMPGGAVAAPCLQEMFERSHAWLKKVSISREGAGDTEFVPLRLASDAMDGLLVVLWAESKCRRPEDDEEAAVSEWNRVAREVAAARGTKRPR